MNRIVNHTLDELAASGPDPVGSRERRGDNEEGYHNWVYQMSSLRSCDHPVLEIARSASTTAPKTGSATRFSVT